MRGLEAFFMGDSSGGDSVRTVARFVGAVGADAGARATGTRAWGVAPRATGTRAGGAFTFCTVDDASVSFSMVSRYSCQATRAMERQTKRDSKTSAIRHQTGKDIQQTRYTVQNRAPLRTRALIRQAETY